MGYRGKFMNQKETICPRAPTNRSHDLLPKCGRAACVHEITFLTTAVVSRSIFCHDVYRQASITADNAVLSELLSLLLSHMWTGLTHLSTSIQNTHTIRHPAAPVIMCGMNATGCESTLAIYRETHCPRLLCLHTMATLQLNNVTNNGGSAKKVRMICTA